jgi:hypothetical protein
MKKILLVLLIIPLVFFTKARFTRSYFSDTEKLTGNTISAGVWSSNMLLRAGSILGATTNQGIDVRFFKRADGKAVGFTATGSELGKYQTYSYSITYDSDGIKECITGAGHVNGRTQLTVENLVLGVCSTGGICVYHPDVKQLTLIFTLNDPDTQTFTVTLPD